MGNPLVSFAIFAFSTAFQIKKQRQLKAQQEAAAEERRGFEFTTSGEASPIPVCYGKNLVGGNAVTYRITNSFLSSGNNADSTFSKGLSTNQTYLGTKNEFLHVQYVLCQEGITGVSGVKVNNLDYDDPDQRFTHLIRTHNSGGVADDIEVSSSGQVNQRFTGCAFAAATFKLDRDDPQYNGAPEMGFILTGRKVRQVNLNGGVYSVGSYIDSNNPALCLLDYLLNDKFGRDLSASDVDLKSFYDAAIICGTTVTTRNVGGIINGGDGTRAIPLFECNVTLSPDDTIRDNIEVIMNTMAAAELTWTSEGKYKLQVEYPTTLAQQNALVDANHYFTDADIIRDNIDINWPSASERYNQVTATFLNEHEDFKSDSITWPTTFSNAHNVYLNEDNNQPFIGTLALGGVTDPYHARASAEQLVREARSARTVTLTVTKKGLSIEPGDFINITSVNAGLDDEVYRVQSIEVNADFTVKMICNYFNYQTLAWNVNDNIAYSVRPKYDFKVEPVTGLSYTSGKPESDHTASGELTWTAPIDGSFKSVVYYTSGGSLKRLGETASDSFLIYPRAEWTNNQSVTFTVKAQTPLGRLSTGVAVTSAVSRNPLAPTSFSLAESLYQTNKASGVKARAALSWSGPVGGVEVRDYKVEYYRDEDGSTNYRLLGYTVGEDYLFDDVRAGNYHFRITPNSWFDYKGTTLIGTKNILGLSAIPNDPTGFVSKVTDSGILLTWDTPTDLDVVSGGTTEIRYVRNDVVTPKWEIAQTIVSKISGSTNTATLPIAAGYYLIKHFDSSLNACANAAIILNSFVGLDYNAIETIAEDPTFLGTKTNCTVVGSNLELDAGFSTMTYLFNNSIDLGSVENIRLVPSLTALITDGVTVVADYDPVSTVTRFAGPIVDASVSFEVRTTNDDPTGTPTWSDWETFTVGNYRNRAFEFRLTAVVASVTYTVEISGLSLTADKADVNKRGTSTSSASVDTTVIFANSFYGGIGGTDIPYIGISTTGGAAGDTVNITSITKDDFTYSVYNSGARVSRQISWQAVGQ
jgi:hypothetical protein